MTHALEVCFGGPDKPPGHLRDVLAQRVADTPAGGRIDWVTYYFRDRQLAEELLRAHKRGVHVTLTLAATPRAADANQQVMSMLSGTEGLGAGLRAVSLPGIPAPAGRAWQAQLHEKLYCFSHPEPIAFVGSFNPSGDNPEERPDIIEEIGDQDRGHNMLVGLRDPGDVETLVDHARFLNRASPGVFMRFSRRANRCYVSAETQLHLWPRVLPHPVTQFLKRSASGSRVRIAASHLRSKAAVKIITALARRSDVQVLAEHTLRRVPPKIEHDLTDAGVSFRRVHHSEGWPMHLKFVLVEMREQRWTVFGSFNWTAPSHWLNHEIAAISTNRGLFDACAERWDLLAAQCH